MLVEAAAAASARRRSRAPLVAGAARGLKALNTRAEVVRSMRVFGDQTAAARRVGDLSSALRLSSSQLEASVLTPSLYTTQQTRFGLPTNDSQRERDEPILQPIFAQWAIPTGLRP